MTENRLTHVDEHGAARMVDVSAKAVTAREATAAGRVLVSPEVVALLRGSGVPKGDAIAVARIALGLQQTVSLGNLDARRDWGFAGDYVDAMWRMLQQPQGDDYVVATGETHSIREFLDLSFTHVGIDDWENHVNQDPRFFRPAEVDLLIGDPTKARDVLGWQPSVDFPSLV